MSFTVPQKDKVQREFLKNVFYVASKGQSTEGISKKCLLCCLNRTKCSGKIRKKSFRKGIKDKVTIKLKKYVFYGTSKRQKARKIK